jgi:transglutaminase-like putative cysteine protease
MRNTLLSVVAAGLAGCSSAPHSVASAHSALTPDAARFAVTHTLAVPVPDGAREVRIWFPLPRRDPAQDVADLWVEAPAGWRETEDAAGNRYVYVQVAAPPGKVAVKTSFTLTRREQNVAADPARTRPLTAAERAEHAAALAPNQHVVLDDAIRTLAAEIRGSEENPVRVARKLYDWTLANVEYWVKDPKKWKASPVGSSRYCLESRTGNCTDFHSLWTALARASGLPTRMQYGSLFKPALDGADRDASYHCWPEFWAPGLGWVPHDVAVADIFVAPIALDAENKEKVTLTTATGYDGPSAQWVDYYFGNLDARRVTWTTGRDLTLEPPQQAGPVNAVAKGYVEVDGKEFAGFERKMTYRELPAP